MEEELATPETFRERGFDVSSGGEIGDAHVTLPRTHFRMATNWTWRAASGAVERNTKMETHEYHGYSEAWCNGIKTCICLYDTSILLPGSKVLWEETGKPKFEYHSTDDPSLYEIITYYSNGKMADKVPCIKNPELAEFTCGALRIQMRIIYHGLIRKWHQNGKMKQEIFHWKGIKEGLATKWREDGSIKSRKFYAQGRIQGIAEKWHENGNLKSERTFDNGFLGGQSRKYWPNGKLKLVTNFEKDIKHGIERTWDETGYLTKQGLYVRGERSGKHLFRDRDRGITETCEYSIGVKWGPARSWINGMRVVACNYVAGKLDGRYCSWYEESGRIKRIALYEAGHLIRETRIPHKPEELTEKEKLNEDLY